MVLWMAFFSRESWRPPAGFAVLSSGIALLTLGSLAFGCADQTAITVEVSSSDLSVPADLDQLRVMVTAPSGVMADTTTDLPGTWPQTLVIRPGSTAAGEAIQIRVFGLRAGTERVRRVVSNVRFSSGTNQVVRVELTRSCLDVMCASPDADCNAGMCIGEMSDAGVDATVPFDAGPDMGVDGFTPDAPGVDAPGTDAGTDGGTDAGTDAGTDVGPMDAGPDPILIISEVVEGSGNNKAVEVSNIGGGTADLSGCVLLLYVNAGTSTLRMTPLTGSLGPNASFVACNSTGDIPAPLCDISGGQISHNGNDAYVLQCDGVTLDSFGANDLNDPGEAWTGGGVSTKDRTLRRKCSVTMGDTMTMDAFDPSVEWDAFAIDTFTGLGEHCP